MKTVGLTGGIASGKSTVGQLLQARAVPVIDADQISREILAPGTEGQSRVLAAFGDDLRLPDGQIDRAALGRRVMEDPQARRRLEAITHPLIGAAIQERLAALARAGHSLAVVEAALMVESGSFQGHDAVLLVSCAPHVQEQRLLARNGFTAEQARRWIGSQLPQAERARLLREAEARGGPRLVELVNDGSTQDLARALDLAWAELHTRLAEGRRRT